MSQQLTKTILIGQILDFCWLVRVSLFIDLGQGEGGERGGHGNNKAKSSYRRTETDREILLPGNFYIVRTDMILWFGG